MVDGGRRKSAKIGNTFNRCVKSVRKTVKARKGSTKESAAIAICTKSVLQTRGKTMKRYRKGRLTTQRKIRGGAVNESQVREVLESLKMARENPELNDVGAIVVRFKTSGIDSESARELFSKITDILRSYKGQKESLSLTERMSKLASRGTTISTETIETKLMTLLLGGENSLFEKELDQTIAKLEAAINAYYATKVGVVPKAN